MKKFITPLPPGGIPFFADDFTMLQNEMFTAYVSMFGLLDSEIVLSGCNVTIIPGSPLRFTIGSGYVLIDGEVLKFDGYTTPTNAVTNAVWLRKGSPTQYSRTMGPNSPIASQPVTEELKATAVVTAFSATAPAAGVKGIRFYPYTSKRLPDIISRKSKRTGEIIVYGGATTTVDGFLPLFDGTGKGQFEYEGFALCNGQNATADLRGRFIVGMSNSDFNDRGYSNPEKNLADYNAIGKNVGGARSVFLTKSNIPAHTHNYGGLYTEDAGNHNHGMFDKSGGGGGDWRVLRENARGENFDNSYDVQTQWNGTHSHNVRGNTGDGSDSGLKSSVDGHENRPPFYTVAYIQRIA